MSRCRAIVVAVLLMVYAACNGDDDGVDVDGNGGGPTLLTGAIESPPAAQCAGCSTANRQVAFFSLEQDSAPRPIGSATSDAEGRYASPDLTAELGIEPLVIGIAGIGQGAFLGGADSLDRGATNVKDFSVATQVACQAVLDIVAGTALAGGSRADGCEVTPDGVCEPGVPCWFTLYQGSFDDARIALLEDAAALIAPRVNLQTDVFRAACAVINCTFEGAGAASQECLDAFFP